jgi:alcohol dehydrogenase
MTITYHFRAIPTTTAGNGCARQLGPLLTQQFPHARHPLLLSDPGMAVEPIFDDALASLDHSRLRCHTFLDIVSNPPDNTAKEAVELAREYNADLIIGLGGGSVMDVAKRCRNLMRRDEGAPTPPLVLLPTNPGSCAATTDRSHAWTSDGQVHIWKSPDNLPDALLIEHEALHSAPDLQVAAAALHAIGTAADALACQTCAPMSYALAVDAVRLLTRHLLNSAEHHGQSDCRAMLAAGANMAGLASQACTDSPLAWLSTRISANHRLPLTLVTAVLLPAYLIELNIHAPATLAQLTKLALPQVEGTVEAHAAAFIVALQQITRSVGLESTLPQLGVQERDIADLLKPLQQQQSHGMWLTEKRAETILMRAMTLCG